MSKELTFSGWKAILVVVLIMGVVGVKFIARSRALQTHAVDNIKTHLVADYARHFMPALQRAAQTPGIGEEHVKKFTDKLSKDNIELVSISARGHGDEIVAKVEIEVDGQDPPDGKRIRYFKMKYSSLTGWTVQREVTGLSYYLSI